jgi:hypothetical protein
MNKFFMLFIFGIVSQSLAATPDENAPKCSAARNAWAINRIKEIGSSPERYNLKDELCKCPGTGLQCPRWIPCSSGIGSEYDFVVCDLDD